MASTSEKTKKETFHNYHRFESRCYETASGFQTIWGPLTQQTDTSKMRNITTRHLYFLSRILQDSLLTRNLNQAVAAMIGLSGKCEKVVELFCLAGLEILKSIPHGHMLCLKFYKNMFLACADHQQEILLNFALYLVLRQRDVVEALELLKSKSSKLQFNQSLMHKAYIAQFEYMLHQPKKSQELHSFDIIDSEEENDSIFHQTFPTNMNFSLKRSAVLFEEVFSTMGVWDMFVPTYAELLQNNEGTKAVQKFLEDYRNKNPLNPNAHRYLIDFLKTSPTASDEEMMNVLEDLIKLDSTSEYVRDLIELKLKSGDIASIVRMLFEKLDHSGCMFDEETWKQLDSYLEPGCIKQNPDLKRELELCWETRKKWWPSYHFRLSRNFIFSDDLKEVMLYKSKVAEYFLGEGNTFSKEVDAKYYGTTKREVRDKTTLKRRLCNSDTESGVKTKRMKR